MPAFSKYEIPIPLGGTSNHLKTSILKKVTGWDEYNVIEDADLTYRLYKNNFKIKMLNSYTFEETIIDIRSWIKQRSRWIKWHIITFLIQSRTIFNINNKANFIKYVFILILLTFNAYEGEMENKNISLDKDKIIEVSIGNKVYKPAFNQEKRILNVLKIPEDEKILRMKSIEIGESELPLVADFMKKYLLPTMYESGGIGIAVIQVGVPIRAFAVDIAKTKIINKDESDKLDIRLFLRGKLKKETLLL